VLHAATSDGLVGQNYGPVIGAMTLLLRACEDAGTIRSASTLDLVMDGLRSGTPDSTKGRGQ
jgi:hypothetical protein